MNSERAIQSAKNAYKKVLIYTKLLEKKQLSYDNIFENDNWNMVPLVDKKWFLYNNCEEGISAEFMLDRVKGNLACTPTSGSTGKCMNVYWNKPSMDSSMLELWILRRERYGINSYDRCCSFYSSARFNEICDNDVHYQMENDVLAVKKEDFVEEKLNQIYNIIWKFDPKWMILQPSFAVIFAQYIQKNNLPLFKSLSYIETTGEMLFDDVRQYINSVFGCTIANQYGCNEVNSIAYECSCGNLHCMSSNVYVETIKDGEVTQDGEEGVIYVTSLKNPVMPFIRYCTEDSGIIYKNVSCQCGSKSPILKLNNARCMEWILHEDGSRTSPYVIVDAIEKINGLTGRIIKQFQVEQNSYEEIVIRLVADTEEYTQEIIMESIVEVLDRRIVDDLDVYFEFYDELFPDNLTGKLKFFVCNIK